MKDITTFISPLVESQFPSFYAEDGKLFIAFMKAYYEWLEETNNTLFHSRRLLEYSDIDQTVEEFLVYFKEQTLKNVQFNTATNKRLLIKNALDIYRSKGTERAIDLFFKLVFAQPASVHYPGDDIFKLSDNKWKIPTYVEVSETKFNSEFEGKQITGLTTGATAFVESYSIKKQINTNTDLEGNKIKSSKNIHVFFISNLKGSFKYGEKITHSGITDPRNCPTVVGSLNRLEVLTGASNYNIGDVVTLSSNTGINGKAVVTSIFSTTGQVEFTLIDGGWGYTTSPEILISEKVLRVANLTITKPDSLLPSPFKKFESFVQPKANINFTALSGGKFVNNDLIYNYNIDNSLAGYGKIINITYSTSVPTTGNLYVSVLSGNLQVTPTIYNTGNTISATVSGYEDKTATANIIGFSTNTTLVINDLNDKNFIVGESIYQANSKVEWANGVIQKIIKSSTSVTIEVSNTQGAFINTKKINGRASLANGTLQNYYTNIGIKDSSITSISSINIVANGINYSNGDVISFLSSTGYGAYARVKTDSIGAVSNVIITRPGRGYLTTPTAFIANSATQYFFYANQIQDNFITIQNNPFINAQYVQYKVSATNTAITGLVNNQKYYVRIANSSGIKLSDAPKGDVISISAGLNQNGHSFTPVISGGYGAVFSVDMGDPIDYDNNLFFYGKNTSTTAYVDTVGQGSLASFKIISLDDEEINQLNSDFLSSNNIFGADYMDILIDASANTALSGSNAYGFPANPAGNLTHGSIKSMLTIDDYLIGSISLIGTVNPGEDYNLDPIVTVFEPVVYGYKKSDMILTTRENTSGFLDGENILYIVRKNFDSKFNIENSFIKITDNLWGNGSVVTYITDNGNTVIGGLANNYNYYIVQANTSGFKLSLTNNGNPIILTPSATSEVGHNIQTASYSTLGKLKSKINKNTLQVTRLSLFKDIPEYANSFIKGESSNYVAMVPLGGKDITFSGLNADISANVITANGSVKTLKVIDSGFGYERFDVGSFSKEGDPDSTVGVFKALIDHEGQGQGFYQNTKGFLSSDKYLQDGDYYQDYSYEIKTKVPVDKYSIMLKKVLHVAGTKAFHSQEVLSNVYTPITANKNIELRRTFNPTTSVDVVTNFISIENNTLANGALIKYSVDDGNTEIITASAINRIKSITIGSAGQNYDSTVNNQIKVYSTKTFNPVLNVDYDQDFITLSSNPFVNTDVVKYIVAAGNTAMTNLSNGSIYYVVQSNSSGVKLSSSLNGSPVNLLTASINESGHSLSGASGNTIIATFANNSLGNIVSINISYYGNNYTTAPDVVAVPATSLSNGAVFNVNLTGVGNNSLYYAAFANSSGLKLSLTANGSSIVDLTAPLPNENGHGISNIV